MTAVRLSIKLVLCRELNWLPLLNLNRISSLHLNRIEKREGIFAMFINVWLFALFQTIDDPSTLGYYPVSKAVLGNGIIDIQLSDILR